MLPAIITISENCGLTDFSIDAQRQIMMPMLTILTTSIGTPSTAKTSF